MAISKHLQAPWNKPEREATAAASQRPNELHGDLCFFSGLVSAGLGFGSKGGPGALALTEDTRPSSREVSPGPNFPLSQVLKAEAERQGPFCPSRVVSDPL